MANIHDLIPDLDFISSLNQSSNYKYLISLDLVHPHLHGMG
jgi:hypothetical protein